MSDQKPAQEQLAALRDAGFVDFDEVDRNLSPEVRLELGNLRKEFSLQGEPRPMVFIRDAVGNNSIEHRTAADVMRSAGCGDDDIEYVFGYIPPPIVAND